MSVLPVEPKFVIYMNVVMLILVAIVLYLLFNVDFANPNLTVPEYSAIQDYASSLFAVDLATILAILASFSHINSLLIQGQLVFFLLLRLCGKSLRVLRESLLGRLRRD